MEYFLWGGVTFVLLMSASIHSSSILTRRRTSIQRQKTEFIWVPKPLHNDVLAQNCMDDTNVMIRWEDQEWWVLAQGKRRNGGGGGIPRGGHDRRGIGISRDIGDFCCFRNFGRVVETTWRKKRIPSAKFHWWSPPGRHGNDCIIGKKIACTQRPHLTYLFHHWKYYMDQEMLVNRIRLSTLQPPTRLFTTTQKSNNSDKRSSKSMDFAYWNVGT